MWVAEAGRNDCSPGHIMMCDTSDDILGPYEPKVSTHSWILQAPWAS